MPDANGQPLPPLPAEAFDGAKETVTLTFQKCLHELELIDSTHIRCKKCPAGWQGPGVYKLLEKKS